MSVACSNESATPSERPSLWAYPLIAVIFLYRMTLSPIITALFGHSCRFEPSCSKYAEQALRKHGAWRGSIKAAKRLSRCHPWHEGGFDPVE